MTTFFESFKQGAIKNALPLLVDYIEKHEEEVAETLRKSLIELNSKHPEKAQIFLQKWNLLNTTVTTALSPAAAAGGKRTRRKGRKHRKHSKY